jgi:site-specific recombinase XerD
VEEIIALMRAAGGTPEGLRLRGVIVMLWHADLRISEALTLTESDLHRKRGAGPPTTGDRLATADVRRFISSCSGG